LEFTIFGHSFRLLVGLDSFGVKVKPALIGLITVVDAVDIADASFWAAVAIRRRAFISFFHWSAALKSMHLEEYPRDAR